MTGNDPIQENKHPMSPSQKEERTWATFCHLSALAAFIGIPFANILGPLIIWLIKKNDMPLVEEEGRAVLNFQISMTIYTIIAFVLCFVAVGFLLIFPIILANVILVVIAAIKTSNGEKFQYPCTIVLIK